MTPVTQEWTHGLTMMQQSVLFTAVRGPDGIPKYSSVKYILRWFRRCVLLSAMDRKVFTDPITPGGGSFTGPIPVGEGYSTPLAIENWEDVVNNYVDDYLREA